MEKKTTILEVNDLLKKRETSVLIDKSKCAPHAVGLDTLKLTSEPKVKIERVENDTPHFSSVNPKEQHPHISEKEAASIKKDFVEANHQLKKPNVIKVVAFIIIAAFVLGILFIIGGITCILLAFLYGISNYSWLLALGIIFLAIGGTILYFVIS